MQLKFLRAIDIVSAFFGGLACLPLVLVLALLIKATSPGPALFRQVRLGRYEKPFVCLKLRTMAQGTLSAATHEVSVTAVTPLGKILRRLKLDELPQLWNVLIGEMSLVGPRPGLPQQLELTNQRRLRGVFTARPGITGPGQVNDIDMSTPSKLAEIDAKYALNPTIGAYIRYVLLTISGRGQGDRVSG